jgi:hypothetical protein
MPDNGTYLLTSVGFSSSEEPLLLLQDHDAFTPMNPIGHAFTVTFDMSTRYCTGWRDITTGERFICPNRNTVDVKYEQCAACQKRTGFNPAFYHATIVSAQQEARNQEPHILYLAHFGPDTVKVGISLAARGNSRLLEQGARTALILDTFPTAHIARHYEAKIAQVPGIVETLQQRKKSDLLIKAYDATAAKNELIIMKRLVEEKIGMSFNGAEPIYLDARYFSSGTPPLDHAYDTSSNHILSGQGIGMLGAVLFCQQNDALLYLPLKKHVGYKMTINTTVTPIDIPARQTSLF